MGDHVAVGERLVGLGHHVRAVGLALHDPPTARAVGEHEGHRALHVRREVARPLGVHLGLDSHVLGVDTGAMRVADRSARRGTRFIGLREDLAHVELELELVMARVIVHGLFAGVRGKGEDGEEYGAEDGFLHEGP